MKNIKKFKGTIISIIIILLMFTVANFMGETKKDNQVSKNVAANTIDKPSNTTISKEVTESKTCDDVYVTDNKKTEVKKEQKQEIKVSNEERTQEKPTENKHYCTISIKCDTIKNNIDDFNQDKIDIIPSDYIILNSSKVEFFDDETVFNVLKRETKKNKIHFEFVNTPLYKSAYIEGIGNIYELDCKELSGWMYKVNGEFPNYGCSKYKIKDNDVIEWVYTCDLGKDVGGDYSKQNGR